MEVTLKLDITPEQFLGLLTKAGIQNRPRNRDRGLDGALSESNNSYNIDGRKIKSPYKVVTEFEKNTARQVPVIGNLAQYLRNPHEKRVGAAGRPSKLNEAGMKMVWDLNRQGFKCPEIARAFAHVIKTEAVRRLIKRIEAA